MRHALRVDEPLIDLGMFRNRTFAAASGMLVLFAIVRLRLDAAAAALPADRARRVRARSGLLLAPQGLGAMLMMPIAGQLTDRTGIGRIVLTGMTLILAAVLALTQIGADTSYWTLSAILFVFGMGMGSTMMPIMSGAMQTLRRAAGRPRDHDPEHPPAGRRLDRHRRADRDPHAPAG